MQSLSAGSHPGVSSVLFMPMIDQKSTDVSCILSTMHFADRYNKTSVLTFDQPLFWKAMKIQLEESSNSKIKDCVLRLGGFHMCMSFLGAIGHLMQGSGLASVFDLIYAESTVPYMMSGKAISRAIRAHLILYACLIGIQVAVQYNFDILIEDGENNLPKELPEEVNALYELSQKLSQGEISVQDIDKNEAYS